MGDKEEFKRAVQLVTKYVNFNKCSTVQVFEASIRCVLSTTQFLYFCVSTLDFVNCVTLDIDIIRHC